MAVIGDYLAPPVSADQRIDPAQVLLIVNSDSGISAAVADYYQAARGLGSHRLSFALGANPANNIAAANRYADIIVPVADYIAAHGIQAVICSAGVPAKFNDGNTNPGFNSGNPYGISTDAMLGAARYWQALGGLGAAAYGRDLQTVLAGHDPAKNSVGTSYTTASSTALTGATPVTPNGNGYPVAMTFDPWWLRQGGAIIPWGRIGFPAYDGAAAETYPATVRMIDDCLWAEAQGRRSVDYFAMIADYSGNGKHPWQWYAWQMMQAAGHQCRYAHETNTGINATESAWFGQAHDVDWQAFKAGTAPVAADAYLGSIIRNLPVGDAYANSLQPKRGAWAFNWTSNGNRFVANLINRGGAAGIGPAMEPYNIGMPDDGSVIAAALRGYSLGEINWLVSPASWAMTAWGDPLYRPFPAQGLVDGVSLAVTDATPARHAQPIDITRSATTTPVARGLTHTTPARTALWQS